MSLVSRQRPSIRQLEVNDQLVHAKRATQSKYFKDVYYAAIVNGNTELIQDALDHSEEFAALHEEHMERLRSKGAQKTLKGKDCIGYAITWNPPTPLADSYQEVKDKFQKFVIRKWMKGTRIWTVDQRSETVDLASGFHVHAWIPKIPGIQQYEFAKFCMALVSYFGQPIGPTLHVKCVPDMENMEVWKDYINYDKDDDKIEVVTATKEYVKRNEHELVYYEVDQDQPDEDEVSAADSVSQAGSSSSWMSGYESIN